MAAGTPVFRVFEHKIEVFVRFFPRRWVLPSVAIWLVLLPSVAILLLLLPGMAICFQLLLGVVI